MTLFDQILPTLQTVLQAHADQLAPLGELLVNRDLNGRVRLIVREAVRSDAAAMQTLHSLCNQLAEQLGPHAWPAERAVLFEEDLQQACDQTPGFALEDFPQIRVVDRLATEGDWSRIAAQSSGAPRVVFFSIKGGVGRSTALAASAWALAQQGRRVLVLDLDLESPGLSSALLPAEQQPQYGITDWLIEDLVDNAASVLDDMVSLSPLSRDGEIRVVPAHGRDPGEYINKLGRIWMPKVQPDGRREDWSQRLSRLIDALEQQWRPDVILIDSRAGIDEVASSCLTDLGAKAVLLFAIDGEQTWAGYRILFQHWLQYGVAKEIRERLQVVGAMLPDDERRRDYFQVLRERSHCLFLETLYDAVDAGEVGDWTFAVDDPGAPHSPTPVNWSRSFFALQSLHARIGQLDQQQVATVLGELIQYIGSLIDPANGNIQ